MSSPYYEQSGITIYHGDCLRFELCADVVVSDPPYGISHGRQPFNSGKVRRGKRPDAAPMNDWHPPSDWDLAISPAWCVMACSFAPTVAWFGHWRKRSEVEDAMTFPIRCEIVWAKDAHVGPPCPVAMRDERIWIFSLRGVRPTRFETSVWDVPMIPTWAHRHHKNEKPESLMLRLLSWLGGDSVIDPFMGSGTTLVAAKRLNRRAIGIDINEEYCEIAAKRLSQDVLPLNVA